MKHEIFRYESHADVKPFLVETETVCVVGMGESAVSDSGLYTGGAGPCVVIVGHNQETGKGLMGHFVSLASNAKMLRSTKTKAEEFASMIDGLTQLGSLRTTEIWLGGGSPRTENGRDVTILDRIRTEEMVVDYLDGKGAVESRVNILWSEPGRVIDVELDCRLGSLAVHEYPAIQRTPEDLIGDIRLIKERSEANSDDAS